MSNNKEVSANKAAEPSAEFAAATQLAPLTADRLAQLLELLLKKDAALAVKEVELAKKREQFDAKAREASSQYTIAKIEAQRTCKHLKGGASRKRTQVDPNVYMHRFADGKAYIKCNSCGAKWFEKDTKDYLFRNGNAIPNWTKIGWAEAMALLEESSNKFSSSEMFPRKPQSGTVPTDAEGAQVPNLQV